MTASPIRVRMFLAILALTVGCGIHREPGTAGAVGRYDGWVEQPGESPRKVALRLWIEAPDRVHLEVSGPLGGPQVVVDGGGGRLAVVFPADRRAFVGASDAAGVRVAIGFSVSLGDVVRAVLDGTEVHDVLAVERRGPAPGLPESLRLSAEGRAVSLRLREVRKIDPRGRTALGIAGVPAGFDVLPLERLSDSGIWQAGAR